MKVSIVIPYYNSSIFFKTIYFSIEEYLNDSNYEIIFIDDNSLNLEREKLSDFIGSLNAKNVVLLINEINLGASSTRKKGVNFASGKYIAFLDADDAWHKNKLKFQYDLMEKMSIDILGGRINIIDFENLKYFNENEILEIQVKEINFNKFLFKNYYSTPSVMVLKNVILSENFSDGLRYSEDYDCWRRISLRYKAYFMDNSYTYSFKHDYLSSGNSLSSNLLKMSIGELKGLILLFKKKLLLYQYLLIISATMYSVLKALRRILKSYTR